MWKYLLTLLFITSTYARSISETNDLHDERIVGGRICSIAKHNHQISLRYRSCLTCTYSHSCGGSIISENFVLTAAHCTNNRLAADLLVVAGTNIRNGGSGVPVRVEKIIQHEGYNSSITDNDVSLLLLGSSLTFGTLIGPIALASEQPLNGENSIVTGWGTTTEGGYSSNQLLEVEVPIVSNDLCDIAYGGDRITDAMLCAGHVDGGKDACQGDSGGPLLVNRQLVGVVSWGRGCARPDYPGVYANVPYLLNWIIENTKLN